MIARVPTGIDDLDLILGGGIPRSSNVLVKGPPGSFKTIFGLQMLYRNAVKNDTPGLYLSLNQPVGGVKEQAEQFGWSFDKTPVQFVTVDTTTDVNVERTVFEAIKKIGKGIVVIDSLTSFLNRPPLTPSEYEVDPLLEAIKRLPGLSFSDEALVRAMTARFLRRLTVTSATILFIYENRPDSSDGVCEYLSDGILKLSKIESLGKRTLCVEKMRYTEHDLLPRNITLKENGISFER